MSLVPRAGNERMPTRSRAETTAIAAARFVLIAAGLFPRTSPVTFLAKVRTGSSDHRVDLGVTLRVGGSMPLTWPSAMHSFSDGRGQPSSRRTFPSRPGIDSEGVGMAAHASWKGFLKLSLVSVPVKAFTATSTGSDITLHQLHAKTHARIQYKKVAPEVGEVTSEEIVKGFEYDKGQYVIIDEEEIDKLRTESDKAIRIDGFIPPEALSSVYLGGRTYYLTPDGPVGQKPYSLLMKGMEANGVCAIAEVVISQKEQVVLVRPVEGILAMTVLNRKDEVKAVAAFKDEVAETESTEAERALADTLIKASIIKEFDFGKYRDVYKEKLTRLIQLKIEGKEVVQVRDPEEPRIINLVEALKRSVEEAQAAGRASGGGGNGGSGEARKTAKAALKQAPSAKPSRAVEADAEPVARPATARRKKVV